MNQPDPAVHVPLDDHTIAVVTGIGIFQAEQLAVQFVLDASVAARALTPPGVNADSLQLAFLEAVHNRLTDEILARQPQEP